jgi:hypothetical protein
MIRNPLEFITEMREMNEALSERLDQIIARLDTLIDLQNQTDTVEFFYGDGK